MRKLIFYIAAAVQVISPFVTVLIWGYESAAAFAGDVLTGIVNAVLWITVAQLWGKVKNLEDKDRQ